jgi:hypothetical protein
MKKKSMLFGLLSVVLSLLVFAVPVMANAAPSTPATSTNPAVTNGITINMKLLPQEAIQFNKKVITSGLLKDFSFDKNGHLVLTSPLSSIKSKYQLSDNEVKMLNATLAFSKEHSTGTGITGTTGPTGSVSVKGQSTISPQLFVSGTVLYFSNSDVENWLVPAVMMGGATALAFELDFLATCFGGPIATVIGIVVGMFSLSALVYVIAQAHGTGQGIRFGVSWNYGWPNPVCECWNG